MMYAVITTGGKQYRVAPGDIIRIEKLGEAEGASVDFDQVLLVNDGDTLAIGEPYIEGFKVSGTVKTQGRGKKVEVIKFRRRKNYRKQKGHRQAFTEVVITAIDSGGHNNGT